MFPVLPVGLVGSECAVDVFLLTTCIQCSQAQVLSKVTHVLSWMDRQTDK